MQEDQKVAWLQDVSSLEKKCQQKDDLINQLYHQLGTQQQQQHVSDAARMMYPATEMSTSDAAGQKLMNLERELAAKRREVEDLRAKVCFYHVPVVA